MWFVQEAVPVGEPSSDVKQTTPPNQQPSQQQPMQQFGDIQALQQLLGQGKNSTHHSTIICNIIAGHGIHETTEDGESLLSLACSAGYFELAEVLLRMRASVEDRGIKGS